MTLYGPFQILLHDATGALTTTPAPGIHYTTDAESYGAQASLLGPYRVTPAHPLQFVLAGDSPENPQWTVAIVFPDQATADAVIAALSA